MSQTFSLTGVGNELSRNYFPPIELNSKYRYTLGLVGFYGCNSIRNIFPGNNKIYYNDKEVIIPSGAYEVEEINKYIQSVVCNNNNRVDFVLKANNNTLKCELKSIYNIDFTKPDSIGRMLGFSPRILEANQTHTSNLDVQIIKATNIHVECNITGGAHRNSSLSHIIYAFGISVEPGYRLDEKPSPVTYLPVIVNQIDNITLRLVDQNGELVDFGNEQVTITLELKISVEELLLRMIDLIKGYLQSG